MPQLDFQWFLPQLFWLLVTFVFLYLMMAKLALPRVAATINGRKERVAADLRKAETCKQQAEKIHADYNHEIAEAYASASKIIGAGRAEVAKKIQKETADFDSNLAVKVAEAEKRIAEKRVDAIKAIIPQQVEICQQIAEKLVNVKVNPARAHAVVNELMKGEK